MADDSAKIYDKIKAKETERGPLFKRMDRDEELYFLKPYVMTYPGSDKPMKNVVNVTYNDAATFAVRAIATLGSAEKQPVVSGRDLPAKKATTIEHFIDDVSYTIDDYLFRQGILALDPWLNEQICIRGHIGARVTFYKEGNTLIPDLLPMDMRYFSFDMGREGMDWGSYTTYRTEADIKSELVEGTEKTQIKNMTGKEDDKYEVVDFYNSGDNIIFIGGTEHKKQGHKYGEPPFVYAKSAGSMLKSPGAVKHDGESIFWMNRDLLDEMSRVASILQTLNMMSFSAGLMYESKAGTKAKPPKKPPIGYAFITPVELGGGYKSMPINDIKNATRLFYATLDRRLQQGGLSAIDYGNLTFPLSAVAITRLSTSRDQIFLPRIQAKAIFYQQLFKMIIRQYIKLGIKAKLGREGQETEYDPEDLKGDYQIHFKFKTESAEQRIANLSINQAAKGELSRRTRMEMYMGVEDPEGEEERLALEEAEQMDEALFLYNRCGKLIAKGENTQAWILYFRLQNVLRARQGIPQPLLQATVKKGEKPGGSQLMPLVGQGHAAGTMAPEVAAEEEEIARAERGEEHTSERGSEAKQEGIS